MMIIKNVGDNKTVEEGEILTILQFEVDVDGKLIQLNWVFSVDCVVNSPLILSQSNEWRNWKTTNKNILLQNKYFSSWDLHHAILVEFTFVFRHDCVSLWERRNINKFNEIGWTEVKSRIFHIFPIEFSLLNLCFENRMMSHDVQKWRKFRNNRRNFNSIENQFSLQ